MALLALGPLPMNGLVAYLISAMLAWSPVADYEYYEPREETLARYTVIAQFIAKVVLDPAEPPALRRSEWSRRDGAVRVVGGVSRVRRLPARRRVVRHREAREGRRRALVVPHAGQHRRRDDRGALDGARFLVNDREKCIRAGLHRMRESFLHCTGQTFIDRLSGYTDGRCRDWSHGGSPKDGPCRMVRSTTRCPLSIRRRRRSPRPLRRRSRAGLDGRRSRRCRRGSRLERRLADEPEHLVGHDGRASSLHGDLLHRPRATTCSFTIS